MLEMKFHCSATELFENLVDKFSVDKELLENLEQHLRKIVQEDSKILESSTA